MTDTRVLVVDREAPMTPLHQALARQGYHIVTASDAPSALARFAEWRPHLVVADWCVLRLSGPELCRQIRATSRTPIIVLSDDSAEAEKVEALDAGADDYVTKPFGVGELLARVRAVLRRAGEHPPDVTYLDVGDFRVDFTSRRVYVGGHEVRLTPKEFDLFVYFARSPNRVLEHRRLLQAVWGELSEDHPEYLRVFVGQLRKKLEPDPSAPRYLDTEPWVGYRFNPSGVTRQAPSSARTPAAAAADRHSSAVL